MIGGGTTQRVERRPKRKAALDWPVVTLSRISQVAEEALAPDRYRIQERDGVRALVCGEAPGVTVRLQPGTTVAASAAVRSFSMARPLAAPS